MTKQFLSRARAAGLILAMLPLAAQAADGTITFAGEIIDSTCRINGGPPPANFLVQLPRISRTAMGDDLGSVAGTVVFPIELSNCPDTMTGQIRAHFELGKTVNNREKGWLSAYRDATGTGVVTPVATGLPPTLNEAANMPLANVGVRIGNIDGTNIEIGLTGAANGIIMDAVPGVGVAPATRAGTLRYVASYVRTGTGDITAGRIVSYIQYSIHYP